MASAGPLSVRVKCLSTSGGEYVAGPNGENISIRIETPSGYSPQPAAILVIYRLPPDDKMYTPYAGRTASALPPPPPPCPQLIHVNPGDCSILRVPNRPDSYAYSADLRVEVYGGRYNWEVTPVHTHPHSPLYLRVRCLGPIGSSGSVRDGHLSVYITQPLPAHQPEPVPVYYLRGTACPPAGAVVTHCPG